MERDQEMDGGISQDLLLYARFNRSAPLIWDNSIVYFSEEY